jgi:hypothetical protein
MSKKMITPEQKEFLKVKRFVTKRFPGAKTILRPDGSFGVVDQYGISIIDPELMLPPTMTVREAWNQAKYATWFTNMIRKSNAAFSDEKIYKKMARESSN